MKSKNNSLHIKRALVLILSVAVFLLSGAAFPQGAAVNTSGASADPSAIFDANSNSQGILIPRMTTAERNLIFSPAQGLQVFNTTTLCLEFYIGSSWQAIGCGCTTHPDAVIAGSHIVLENLIVWVWAPVNGATGYKYNTVNNPNTAIDIGLATSYVFYDLISDTDYHLYVWSYNACGFSPVNQLTQSTKQSNSCGIITFTYKGNSVTYGTVNGQNASCWLDRNLGAAAVATSVDHTDAYGDLFQWGRADDGHQNRTGVSVTTTLSNVDNPSHAMFIIAPSPSYDWRSPANSNLWQGVAGFNNPCPAGWRVPTEIEILNEVNSWSPNINIFGAFASNLKLPAAGTRGGSDGLVAEEGVLVRYWTSTTSSASSGPRAKGLYSTASNTFSSNDRRASGFSLRCVKD